MFHQKRYQKEDFMFFSLTMQSKPPQRGKTFGMRLRVLGKGVYPAKGTTLSLLLTGKTIGQALRKKR